MKKKNKGKSERVVRFPTCDFCGQKGYVLNPLIRSDKAIYICMDCAKIAYEVGLKHKEQMSDK